MPGGEDEGERSMEDSGEESDLEESSKLGKLAAVVVSKKRKASSRIEKEVDGEGEARKLRSAYEEMRREYDEIK